jgi:DNA-binding GntR family transcriptional regulator
MHTESGSQVGEIVKQIQADILLGKRAPGERLDERTLAESFGVSRTPIREALQWLAANGLVSLRGRQGACITELSVPDILDAFYVIAELEAMAARQAARRIKPEQREALQRHQDRCTERAMKNDPLGFYEANIEFHDTILTACHNRILQDQIRNVRVLTAPYRKQVTFQPGRMHESIPEHEAIMQAIFVGDGDGASRMMREHVNLLGEGLSDLLRAIAS